MLFDWLTCYPFISHDQITILCSFSFLGCLAVFKHSKGYGGEQEDTDQMKPAETEAKFLDVAVKHTLTDI